MAKKVLSREQLFRLGDLIRAHCYKNPEGFAQYEPPWSDKEILKTLGEPYNLSHVAHLRAELVGNLKKQNRYNKRQDKIDVLLTRIELLELWASERPVAPYKK